MQVPFPLRGGTSLEDLKPIPPGQAHRAPSHCHAFDPGLCLGKLLSSRWKSGISGSTTHGGDTYQIIQIIIYISGNCWKQISWNLQNDHLREQHMPI